MRKLLLSLIIIMTMIIGVQPAFAVGEVELCASPDNSGEYIAMLHDYAPVIWYSKAETYWPSSMEEMHSCAKVTNNKVKYTKPLCKLKGTFSKAKNYAFYCQLNENTMKLVYRQYYMFDPGKGMILCHYGDWEGCEIIFTKSSTGWTPTYISYNHHGINTKTDWTSSSLEKYDNHPVLYAARGSHGLYLSAGLHQYKKCLYDSTGRGTCWQTTNSLESYYYDASSGLKSIDGADHVNEFTNITKWGQSYNSPDTPMLEYLNEYL